MQRSKTLRLIGAAAAVALFASACSGDDGEDPAEPGATDDTEATDGTPDETDTPVEGGDGIVSTYIGEPEHLVTTNTNESEGIAVLRALYTGLINYDPITSEPTQGVATSVESDDNGLTWNVVLEEGWTFHDGTPVTTQSFADAWNYGANGLNAQGNQAFFSDIAGYEDLQCGTRPATAEDVEAELAEAEGDDVIDCEASAPAAETLSGIGVVSDTEMTVTLNEAQSFWNTKLGYAAFFPLPEAFFADPDGFNEAPIGNGPFMMDGEWQHDQAINTVAYPDYAGAQGAQVDGIEFRIYGDVNTAVTDLEAGELDIVDAVPGERWAEVQGQVPNSDDSPSSSINYLGFPQYAAPFDNPDLRAALSMAIDREAITETILDGGNLPANNLLAPVIPGYQDVVCDEWTHNPEEAVARFEASGVDLSGGFDVWFNEGAAHDAWIEAVVNQWATTLGIDANGVTFQSLQFAEYLGVSDEQGFTGPFRLGWGMDYPHPQNYLQLLLQSDFTAEFGGANSTHYNNADFDAKLAEAIAITDIDEAIPVYQEAAAIACADAPLAPMFYGLNKFAWNDGVDGVYVDAFGDLDYTALTTG